MSLDMSLDSSSGWIGKAQDISTPNNTEKTYKRLVKKRKISPLFPLNISILLDSLTFVPSVKEIPYAGRNKYEAS